MLKIRRGWLLQEDNDPKRTSKSTMDEVQVNCPQSPGLNIILKLLWTNLRRVKF